MRVIQGRGIGFLDGRRLLDAGQKKTPMSCPRLGWPQGLVIALLSSNRYCTDLSLSERGLVLARIRQGEFCSHETNGALC